MPRLKGLDRIIRRGEKGPKFETLLKTLERHGKKTSRKAARGLIGQKADMFEFTVKKTWRHDQKIAVGKALSAIGLDTRDPVCRAIRGYIHQLVQRRTDLLYDANNHPDRRFDPEVPAEIDEINRQMVRIIAGAKGIPAVKKFDAVWGEHQGTVNIAHGELAKRLSKRT